MNKLKEYINTLPNEFKGDLKGFPKIVVAAMVVEQYNQGNEPNYKVFEKRKATGRFSGGFKWSDTKQKNDFWAEVIYYKNFKHFLNNYDRIKYLIDIIDSKITEITILGVLKAKYVKGYKMIIIKRKEGKNYLLGIEENDIKNFNIIIKNNMLVIVINDKIVHLGIPIKDLDKRDIDINKLFILLKTAIKNQLL